MTRRSLFTLIGVAAGGAVMLEAMSSLAYAGESGYQGPIKLSGDPKGASVLILGAGLAGMCAAYELRKAGYKVQFSNTMIDPADGTGRSMAATSTPSSAGLPRRSASTRVSI